ncbi:MAG: hypothetical protein OEZ59_06400 [Deltaproteobacteria bacterium]|nr:hypothetical protein [Deltaproteobacteria bacterium]
MILGRDPRKKKLLELAMQQVERVLKDMQKNGADLERLKIKKYQKTHYTSCTCPRCLEANRTKDPHKRGLLEDGYKLYVEVDSPTGGEQEG